MTNIEISPFDNIFTILQKIKDCQDSKIELILPEGSLLFANATSLQLLQKQINKLGKDVSFFCQSKIGKNLLEILNQEKPETGFVETDIAESQAEMQKQNKLFSWLTSLQELLSFSFLKIVFLFFCFFVLLFIVCFAVWWYFPSAKINLLLNSEPLVKSIDMIASSSATKIDLEQRVIPALKITVTDKISKKASPTGKKLVGDKAKGVVTIYNKTENPKTFDVGTILSYGRTEDEDLRFFLDAKITVAERQASTSAETAGQTTVTYIYGKKEVAVTAEKIGKEYNLSKNTNFVIENFSTSDFIASPEDDLSGGESREIIMVAAEDQQKLLAESTDELESKIENDIKNKVVGDQVLAKDALNFEITKKNFDKAVGEEANEFNLSLEARGVGLVYSQSNLEEALSGLLLSFVPENYELFSKEQEVSAEITGIEGDNLLFLAKIKGYIIPKINEEEIKNDLIGVNLQTALHYLNDLPNIEASGVELSPIFLRFLPKRLQTMPHKREKIEIRLERQ